MIAERYKSLRTKSTFSCFLGQKGWFYGTLQPRKPSKSCRWMCTASPEGRFQGTVASYTLGDKSFTFCRHTTDPPKPIPLCQKNHINPSSPTRSITQVLQFCTCIVATSTLQSPFRIQSIRCECSLSTVSVVIEETVYCRCLVITVVSSIFCRNENIVMPMHL